MRKILLSLQQANAQYPEVFFLEEKNIHFKNEWIFVLLKCLLFAYTQPSVCIYFPKSDQICHL